VKPKRTVSVFLLSRYTSRFTVKANHPYLKKNVGMERKKHNIYIRIKKGIIKMGKIKMTFEVQENESISDCIERMKKLGYTPTRRVEKPIFQEVMNAGQMTYEPVGKHIIFEARAID
jgi:hypothetical protein